MKKEKQIWLELLRCFAAFCVVLLHVASVQVKNTELLYTDKFLPMACCDIITRCGVGLFLMISGSLLLCPKKELSIEEIWKKRIPRVLFMFAVWSFLYAAWYAVKNIIAGNPAELSVLVEKFVAGHYHLWYLWMLAGMYMILPILREIAGKKRLLEYFLLIGTLFVYLPAMLAVFPEEYQLVKNVLDSKMIFYFPKGYVTYFLMGYYLTEYELPKWLKALICGGGGNWYCLRCCRRYLVFQRNWEAVAASV